MGKISDALERHKKEKSINLKPLRKNTPNKSPSRAREISFAREFCTLNGCSPKTVMLSAPDSPHAESFRILRTQILFSRKRGGLKTILVTSPLPGEGKTFVAANLAVSLAMGTDAYVLLIDSDLRRPQMHRMLGYGPSEGLHEYLSGRKQLENLIIRTQVKKLSILPAGNVPSNFIESLAPSNMETLLKQAKELHKDQFIVIDSPPARGTAEATFLANYVDGIILVVMAQKAPRDAIYEAIQNLGKEKILGIVFNGYNQAHKRYSKYYKNYYGGK